MKKAVIAGAGELGAALAARLAAADWAGEVVLLGRDSGVARGKALDLLQSGPVLASDTRVRGAGELEELAGASYLLVAGPDGAGRDAGADHEARLFEAARSLAREAIVVIAGNDPAAMMQRAAASARLNPGQLLGTSPVAFAAAWRRRLARALGCSPQDVAVSIAGAPPAPGLYEVFAAAGGVPIEGLLPLSELRRAGRDLARDGRSGPRALAAAAATVLLDIERKDAPLHSCYCWAADLYGGRPGFIATPALLGPEGLRRGVAPPLEPARRVTIDRSLDYLERLAPNL